MVKKYNPGVLAVVVAVLLCLGFSSCSTIATGTATKPAASNSSTIRAGAGN